MFKSILVAWDGFEPHFVLNHTTVPVLIIHDGDEGLAAYAAV
jgi:hypothetical protein